MYSGTQIKNTMSINEETQIMPRRIGRWYFTDGSWKNKDIYSGNDWYSTLEGFDGLMGARNTRNSLSLLHTEFEAFIWVMESMRNLRQFHVTFVTDCSQSAFASYLEEI